MKIEYKSDGILIDGELINLQDIINKCNDAKIDEENLVIL